MYERTSIEYVSTFIRVDQRLISVITYYTPT